MSFRRAFQCPKPGMITAHSSCKGSIYRLLGLECRNPAPRSWSLIEFVFIKRNSLSLSLTHTHTLSLFLSPRGSLSLSLSSGRNFNPLTILLFSSLPPPLSGIWSPPLTPARHGLRSLRTRTCCGFRRTALRSLTLRESIYAFKFTTNS